MAPNQDEEKNRRGPRNNMASIMSRYMTGKKLIPVLFVNPAHESDTDEDRWTAILPLNGTLRAVRTQLSGYVPMSELQSMGIAIMMNPEAAEPDFCDVPVVDDYSAAKLIHMLVPAL